MRMSCAYELYEPCATESQNKVTISAPALSKIVFNVLIEQIGISQCQCQSLVYCTTYYSSK